MTISKVLVVGASSGIGAAVTSALAERGASVVASARRTDRLEVLAAQHPGLVHAVRLDLANADDCRRGVNEATKVLGGLDAVVIAAGMASLNPIRDTDHDQWHRLMEVNLIGPALVLAEAVTVLPRGGGVVLMSSNSVERAWPGLVAYAAAKAGLETLARGLQVEEPHLNVTNVVVGSTDTEVLAEWAPDRTRTAFRQWKAGGFIEDRHQMKAGDVGEVVATLLLSGIRVPRIELLPDYTVERAKSAEPHRPVESPDTGTSRRTSSAGLTPEVTRGV